MKRIIFTLLAATGLMTVSGQNLNKIKESITTSKFSEAKTAIETFLNNPKYQKNPELYYLKGKVLSAISMNATERASVPEARMLALDAFKKALEIDKNQSTLYLTVDNYKPVFDLYSSGFEEGAAFYNAAKFEEALGTFKNTGVIGDYIFSQGWGLYKLDTTLTYYMGLSALNAKKEDQAIAYFTKLADANVGGNSDMATPYRYLAKYYFDKKDEANMNKYIDAGLKIFPKDDYLPLLAIDHARDKNDQGYLLKTFEKLLKINPTSFDLNFDYAGEIFGLTHSPDQSKVSIGQSKESVIKKFGQPTRVSKTMTQNIETELLIYENEKMEIGLDLKTGKVNYYHELNTPWLDSLGSYDDKCILIERLYKKALELNPTSVETQLSIGKHYYNQILFKEDDIAKIKGTKPEDLQSKANLQKVVDSLFDKAKNPLESAFKFYDGAKSMKISEKSNYKSSASLLNFIYTKEKNKEKADFYQKKYDDADKRIIIGDSKEVVIEKLGKPSSISKTTTENIEIEVLIYDTLKTEVGINVKNNKVYYIHEIK